MLLASCLLCRCQQPKRHFRISAFPSQARTTCRSCTLATPLPPQGVGPWAGPGVGPVEISLARRAGSAGCSPGWRGGSVTVGVSRVCCLRGWGQGWGLWRSAGHAELVSAGCSPGWRGGPITVGVFRVCCLRGGVMDRPLEISWAHRAASARSATWKRWAKYERWTTIIQSAHADETFHPLDCHFYRSRWTNFHTGKGPGWWYAG